MLALAKNLKLYMSERGLTKAGLARETGIPQQTISRYVACQREINLEYLCKIADYLGEEVDVLIGRREF